MSILLRVGIKKYLFMKLNKEELKSKKNTRVIYYDTLGREITELIARSFTFKDIEAIGKDLFYIYSTHRLEGVINEVTISPLLASSCLVRECFKKDIIPDLISYIIQLEDQYLNGKIVVVAGLEDLLYNFTENGFQYDYKQRKLVPLGEDRHRLKNWGSLKNSKAYDLTIGSVDVVINSAYVNKYGMNVMNNIYSNLQRFIEDILLRHKGRLWTWAGDGGLFAFRGSERKLQSTLCAIEIQMQMAIFNLQMPKRLIEPLRVRIGMDDGKINFYDKIGHIVSDTINYAAHIEKKGAPPNGIAISHKIYDSLPEKYHKMFNKEITFENRSTHVSALASYNNVGLDSFDFEKSLQEKA